MEFYHLAINSPAGLFLVPANLSLTGSFGENLARDVPRFVEADN